MSEALHCVKELKKKKKKKERKKEKKVRSTWIAKKETNIVKQMTTRQNNRQAKHGHKWNEAIR